LSKIATDVVVSIFIIQEHQVIIEDFLTGHVWEGFAPTLTEANEVSCVIITHILSKELAVRVVGQFANGCIEELLVLLVDVPTLRVLGVVQDLNIPRSEGIHPR